MNHRILALAALAAALTACGTVADRNAGLEQAHSRFNAAQSNPQVSSLAPDELKRAAESLRLAEEARRNRAATATVDHFSYMTIQRVTIAEETAWNKASQAIIAGAGAERDKMRLAVRTAEADTAQRQLALSQQSNARKTAELAAADANMAREQARVDRRDARVSDLESQLKELNAKKTERGMVVTLGDVLFDSGQSRLLPDGARNLDKLAEVFIRNPARSATIEGYTDSVGPASANYDLSERRANAVRSALVNLGVTGDRLVTRAHGEQAPTASNGSAAGRQMNRRVEIVFTPLAADSVVK